MATNIQITGLNELSKKLESLGGKLRGVEGKVGNNIGYAPYVGSSMFQAEIHENRWKTDQQALDDEMPNILNDFNRVVAAACAEPNVNVNPLLAPMQRAVMRILRVMATYPPAIPGSKYVRTGSYGRKWTTKVSSK